LLGDFAAGKSPMWAGNIQAGTPEDRGPVGQVDQL
jgi:hypothetical protein